MDTVEVSDQCYALAVCSLGESRVHPTEGLDFFGGGDVHCFSSTKNPRLVPA
jgi:hypothetical protein